MESELLTASEVARRLKLRRSTIVSWARKGKIPSVLPSAKVRRFQWEAVVAALARKEAPRA